MSTIPTSVTDEQFQTYILPNLSVAARGYVSKTPLAGIFNLILYRLHDAFKTMKAWGLSIAGAFFNADAAFDTLEARKVCFNHKLIPNIPTNTRNRKTTKRGRKRLFNPTIYKRRFISERTFAWIDKFRSVLVRFDRKDTNFLAAHHLVFALIN